MGRGRKEIGYLLPIDVHRCAERDMGNCRPHHDRTKQRIPVLKERFQSSDKGVTFCQALRILLHGGIHPPGHPSIERYFGINTGI